MALEDAKKQIDHAFTRTELRGNSFENTFAGAASFLRRRYTKDLTGADFAVTGVPFDQAVTNRPGTRLGPRAIREASLLQSPDAPYGWGYNVLEEFAIADYGDLAFDYAEVARFPKAVTDHVAGMLAQGVQTVTLGGDHFITYPMLKANARMHGPLSLIHFDAHRDVEPDDGGRIDHGTMFNYAAREGLIDPKRSVQIGIRTVFTGERTYGFRIIYADEVHNSTAGEIASIIKEVVGHNKAYLTFDIDCLDPSAAPGTGTPVPGGLTYHQAASIIRRLTDVNFVGMDLVEVSPPYDHAELTSLAAASIVMEYLCLKAWQKGARAVPVPE